mgnify:CR=1 FL=1
MPPETYPILIPSRFPGPDITMPFPGEKEDHRPAFYLLRFTRLGGKVPATFRYIYQLILIQDAPGLRLEIILLRMPGKWIGATRRDELISDRRDDDSPFLIRSADRQVT